VISQTLLKKKTGGRVAAFEIMISTSAIQSLIRDNKSYRITSAIQTGHKYGMNLMDEHLMALWKKSVVTYEEALSKAQDGGEFENHARELNLPGGPRPLDPNVKGRAAQRTSGDGH
jgi:twitching motility protein PilT